MIPQIKAEFKKLLTVRSTYIVALMAVSLVVLFTVLMTSAVPEEPTQAPPGPSSSQQSRDANNNVKPQQNTVEYQPKMSKNLPKNTLSSNFEASVQTVSLLIAIVVILLMAHEYRYNTVVHTLTASNNRSKVIGAKILVGTIYAVTVTLIVILISFLATHLAVNIKGLNLLPQEIDWLYTVGRLLVFSVGYSLFGLALVVLLRNLTAAIVGVFLLPTIDNIISGILASHQVGIAKWFPFSALDRVANIGSHDGMPAFLQQSIPRATLVYTANLAVIWAIAWYLFLKRDAN